MKIPFTNFFKLWFNSFADIPISSTFTKRNESSAKILRIGVIPSGRSFIKIKKKIGPDTDPSGTPEFIFLKSEIWPFNTALHLRLSDNL